MKILILILVLCTQAFAAKREKPVCTAAVSHDIFYSLAEAGSQDGILTPEDLQTVVTSEPTPLNIVSTASDTDLTITELFAEPK